jgi:hypothetical protein
MDPNQEEDLKKLSYRTEELLSRLNDLSSTLNSQLKSAPSHPAQSQSAQNPPAPPIDISPKQEQNPNSFYSIPINTHYLEKRERTIKSSGSGQHFLTTSTSIFTEQHHIAPPGGQPPENFVPASLDPAYFTPALPSPQSPVEESALHASHTAHDDFENVKEPTPSFGRKKLNFDFGTNFDPVPARAETNFSGRFAQQGPTIKPTADEYETDAEPLQPSAIFAIDQGQTKRAPQNRRNSSEEPKRFEAKPQARPNSHRITDKLEAQNRELKERLQKYSNRIQISSNGDILKFFAFVAPFFLLGGAIGIINALGIPIYDLPKIFAICSIMVFLGIFFSAMALRLVEISELVRWAHNEILHMQSILDEQKDKD